MILLMTSTQVVETSVTTTDNSPSQDYTNPDDQTTILHIIRLFAVKDGVLVFLKIGNVLITPRGNIFQQFQPNRSYL